MEYDWFYKIEQPYQQIFSAVIVNDTMFSSYDIQNKSIKYYSNETIYQHDFVLTGSGLYKKFKKLIKFPYKFYCTGNFVLKYQYQQYEYNTQLQCKFQALDKNFFYQSIVEGQQIQLQNKILQIVKNIQKQLNDININKILYHYNQDNTLILHNYQNITEFIQTYKQLPDQFLKHYGNCFIYQAEDILQMCGQYFQRISAQQYPSISQQDLQICVQSKNKEIMQIGNFWVIY